MVGVCLDDAGAHGRRGDGHAQEFFEPDSNSVELIWPSGRAVHVHVRRGESFGELAARTRIVSGAQQPLRVVSGDRVFDHREAVSEFMHFAPFGVVVAPVELGVPLGMHHPALVVSPDRSTVRCDGGLRTYCGCFLSGALQRDGLHVIRVAVFGATLFLYIGLSKVDSQQWSDLPMLAVHQDITVETGFYDNCFGADTRCDPRRVAEAFRTGFVTLAVNMHAGRVSLLDEQLDEVGFAVVPGLSDMDVCFSASVRSRETAALATTLRVLPEESVAALTTLVSRPPLGSGASSALMAGHAAARLDGGGVANDDGDETWCPAAQLG